MKFGASLRNISPLHVQEMRTYMMEFAKAADELGFSSLWLADHIAVPEKHSSSYPYRHDGSFVYAPDNSYWEPLTVLASIAAITRRVRLGTSVLVLPLRHPIYAAKVLATLDCLSNGRVILGAGVGWLREEMDLLGAPASERRGALTDEHIRIYRELWTKDRPQFEGRWYRFSGFTFLPKPVQKPSIPIWIGGSTKAALRRVVRLGDGWQAPIQPPDQLAAEIQGLKSLCQKEGRKFEEITLSSNCVVAIDRDAVGKGEAQVFGLDKGTVPTYQGNPDQIARALRRYQEVGIAHMGGHYRMKDGAPGLENSLRAAEIMAKEVIPQVGDSA